MSINRAIVKIPNLAIHLCNLDERERFSPNKESHIRPILSTIVYDKLLNIKENENQKEIQKVNKKKLKFFQKSEKKITRNIILL